MRSSKGLLAGAVFINLNAFTSGTRGSVHIDLDLSGTGQQRLPSPLSDFQSRKMLLFDLKVYS